MIAIVHSIYSQSVHAPALDAGLMDNDAERYCNIETCRYGINRIPVNERLCESCESVEHEYHVLMQCLKYDDIRTVVLNLYVE